MQTTLSELARQLPRAAEAERILRTCVHCGFCNATCPTYQLLVDELDGPRGRIYLIKQVLEGNAVTRKTQQHLTVACRAVTAKPPALRGSTTTTCWISAARWSMPGCQGRWPSAWCAKACAA